MTGFKLQINSNFSKPCVEFKGNVDFNSRL